MFSKITPWGSTNLTFWEKPLRTGGKYLWIVLANEPIQTIVGGMLVPKFKKICQNRVRNI